MWVEENWDRCRNLGEDYVLQKADDDVLKLKILETMYKTKKKLRVLMFWIWL